MCKILLIGLPEEVAQDLVGHVAPQARVAHVLSGQEALLQLEAEPISLAVVNHQLSDMSGEQLLGHLRSSPSGQRVSLIYCLAEGPGGGLPRRLVSQFGVSRLMLHPLEIRELGEHIAHELGLPEPAAVSPQRQPLPAPVMDVWARTKGRVIERVTRLQNACRVLGTGALDEQLRIQAEREAHKLAGSLGTFGFGVGSDLARRIEHLLQAGLPVDAARGRRLAELADALAKELNRYLPESAEESFEPGQDALQILIVDDDRELCDRLAAEAGHWNAKAATEYSVAEARAAIARCRPSAVVLDLSFADREDTGLSLLGELCEATPPIPTVVLTARGGLIDRVEVARLGGRCFLEKPVPPSQVMEAVMSVLSGQQRAKRAKVLAVDDDPEQLAVLRSLLAPEGLELVTLSDPLRFWETIENVAPDMLVLDVDMPHISGLELCRVIRNDPRWCTIPVLFLTASAGQSMIHRVFAAGADDFVGKPIVGPELVTRIQNRLERTKLLQRLADTDPLTGVGNRRQFNRSLQHFLKLAERHKQPVSLGILDLDHFKRVNDAFGHTVGDAVLRRLGELLLRKFRGEDVVARWGGEEFALGMYGMARHHGVHRLAEVLEELRREEFLTPEGQSFRVSFSGGIAQFPRDGTDLLTLTRAADRALYEAKSRGRGRVLPAGIEYRTAGADVLLVLADDVLGGQIGEALVTRGHSVANFRDCRSATAWLRDTAAGQSGQLLVLDADLPEGTDCDAPTLMAEAQARGFTLLTVGGPPPSLPKPLSVEALLQWRWQQEDARQGA
ncbi:MAG TPA: response regulator [Symbiobacteriaceae bacterium]|nr:response regulator [Symbiobacteriaceae bacterium]